MSDEHDAMSFAFLAKKYVARDYAAGPVKEVARDPPPEALMTDEMRRAGSVALGFAPDHVTAGPQAALVFRAMRALEPAPSGDRLRDEIAELTAERDAKDTRIADLEFEVDTSHRDIVLHRADYERLYRMHFTRDAESRAAYSALQFERNNLSSEVMRLRDALAQFTAANVATPEPDKLAHRPFRDHPTDRRRIGA